MELHFIPEVRLKLFATLLVVAFAVVLVVDIILPVGYAVAVIYILLVFASSLSGRVRWVAWASGAAFAGTALAGVLKPRLTVPLPESAVIFNRISITLMIGGIIPPVAIYVFILGNITGLPFKTIYKGVVPFLSALVLALLLLFVFPQIALWLPNLLMGKG